MPWLEFVILCSKLRIQNQCGPCGRKATFRAVFIYRLHTFEPANSRAGALSLPLQRENLSREFQIPPPRLKKCWVEYTLSPMINFFKQRMRFWSLGWKLRIGLALTLHQTTPHPLPHSRAAHSFRVEPSLPARILGLVLVPCLQPCKFVAEMFDTFSPVRAYEHAYNLLESTFLPLFYQSDDVSTLWHLLSFFCFGSIIPRTQQNVLAIHLSHCHGANWAASQTFIVCRSI